MKLRALSIGLCLLALPGCNGAAGAQPPAAKAERAAQPVKSAAKKRPAHRGRVSRPTASASPTASALPIAASVTADAAPPQPVASEHGMLPVPGGTFTMGADDEGEQDERPAHQVTLAGFLLDVHEVTNGEYRQCVEAKVCRPWRDGVAAAMKYASEKAFRGDKQPVVGVSFDDATTYCKWKGKRLPTEAEWERAARGDDGRKYPWGNDTPDPKKHGCFQGCQGGTTANVGSFPEDAGPYGHHDLAGSVWEWLADYYDPYAYKRATAERGVPGSCDDILAAQDELRKQKQQGYTGTNPIPTECERVLRGGAFNYNAKGLRSSNRVHHPGSWRILVAGFRCAKDLP